MLVRNISTRSVVYLDRGTSGLCLNLIGTFCLHWRYKFSCKIHSDYFFVDFN